MSRSLDSGVTEVITLLRRLSVETERFTDAGAAAHQLHRTDLVALAVIMDSGPEPMTPGRLGAELNLSAPATSALLDRLERAGHASRTRSPTDRRRVEIEVTDTARTVGRALYGELGQRLGRVAARYSAAELTMIARFLSDMTTATVAARRGG